MRILGLATIGLAGVLGAAEPDWPWEDDPRGAEVVGQLQSLEKRDSWRVVEPLGTLGDGLIRYLALDGSLVVFDGRAGESLMSFTRPSAAFTPDLQRVERDVPRFVPGRFGEAMLVEYGHVMAGHNQLPAAVASADDVSVFAGVGGASLSLTTGVEGDRALKVVTTAAGAGVMIPDLQAPTTNAASFSAYVKGAAGSRLTLLLERVIPVLPDPSGTAAATPAVDDLGLDELLEEEPAKKEPTGPVFSEWLRSTVELDGSWQRVVLSGVVPDRHLPGHVVPESKEPVRVQLLLEEPGEFLVDALMLETHAGYGTRRGASTWVPGGGARAGEIARLRQLRDAAKGTIAFWMQTEGEMNWRCLLTVGDGHGWSPNLRLDLRDEQMFTLTGEDKTATVSRRLEAPLAVGSWHHVVVLWEGDRRQLFLDGEPLMEVHGAPSMVGAGSIIVGGVATNFSPGIRADAAFDEVACWERALRADEVQALAAREVALGAGMDTSLTLVDGEPVSVFPRDYRERVWPVEIRNRSDEKIEGGALVLNVGGVTETQVALPTVPAWSGLPVNVVWSPAMVAPGSYAMSLSYEGRGTTRRLERQVEIVPPRVPSRNAQVITWGGNGPKMAEAGVTVAGSMAPPLTRDVEAASRAGLYMMSQIRMMGHSEAVEDRMVDAAGTPLDVDQRAPAAVADIDTRASALGEELGRLPDVRYAIPNSEHLWVWGMDFRPSTQAMVRERFGLDLGRWQAEKPEDVFKFVHPFGRLSARAGGLAVPAGGVRTEDGFYAFHRWWHSDAPGNEVFLNDRLASRVREEAPLVKMVVEPALRRPAVRAFRNQDILEEWYYYVNPAVAIEVQEMLTASVRGTGASIHGMPQFLLKPGMAAPYPGMPTPHMFRETVWHCLARPLSGMTYWNLWAVLDPPASAQTPEQMDAELAKRLLPGETLDYKTVRSHIEVDGERCELSLTIPELATEVGRLHREVLAPLAPLLPVWRNQPRKLAVIRSFAGDLFSEVRWPHQGGMDTAIRHLSQPYDILLDQDFEENAECLAGYRVVLIPQAPVVTDLAVKALRRFVKSGGTVVVDQHFQPEIEGMVRYEWQSGGGGEASLQKLANELVARYGRADHPQVVEGMMAAMEEQARAEGPSQDMVRLIEERLEAPFHIATPAVFGNLLNAGEAQYLVLVNDLRVPGPHYGRYGLVREDGVAQKVDVQLSGELGAFAYALPAGRELTLSQGDKGTHGLSLDLAAAGGQVVMMTAKRIAGLKVRMEGTPVPGQVMTLVGELVDAQGQTVDAAVPVAIEILRPDGVRDGFSRHDLLSNGRGRWSFPVALNAPVGKWQVRVRELASGQEAELDLTVRPAGK